MHQQAGPGSLGLQHFLTFSPLLTVGGQVLITAEDKLMNTPLFMEGVIWGSS